MTTQSRNNRKGFFINGKGYIPWRHFDLVRERFSKGKVILSLVYPLSRRDIAEILTARVN